MANASANTFQKMAFGARTMGIEQEKLADILKDVNDRVGDFLSTGGGPMADFFEKIAPKVGVTAQQFEGLSGPEALQLYVSSLERANLSQQEMTFFMESMASDATKLLPLLRNNGEQMGIFADKAERMGIALSDVEVEQIKQDAVAQARARLELEGVAKEHKVEIKQDATDRTIKESVIKAIRGDADLTDKSDAYVDAAYDIATSEASERRNDAAEQRKTATTVNQDGAKVGPTAKSAREKMAARMRGEKEEGDQ